MNILPKKRWHVRTKDNIARVRKDEAEAREKEDKRLEKLKIAESEARINFLRRQNGIPERLQNEVVANEEPTTSNGHIDLFSDFKTHIKIKNKDSEREKKEQREKYEKQIGYLTYLGQDTNEALKVKSWYEVAPKRAMRNFEDKTEKDQSNKYFNDPLTLIHTFLPKEKFEKEPKEPVTQTKSDIKGDRASICKSLTEKSESRKHKKGKKSKKIKVKKEKRKGGKKEKHKSKEYIEMALAEQKRNDEKHELIKRLRKERLQREEAEKERQYALLHPSEKKRPQVKKSAPAPRVKQKYNSQFNPDLAKQNILD